MVISNSVYRLAFTLMVFRQSRRFSQARTLGNNSGASLCKAAILLLKIEFGYQSFSERAENKLSGIMIYFSDKRVTDTIKEMWDTVTYSKGFYKLCKKALMQKNLLGDELFPLFEFLYCNNIAIERVTSFNVCKILTIWLDELTYATISVPTDTIAVTVVIAFTNGSKEKVIDLFKNKFKVEVSKNFNQ